MFRYCTFCMVWSMHPFAFVLEEDTKALKLQVLHIRRWHHQFDTKRWCLFVDQSMNWAHFFFSNANKGKMKHSSNPNAILMLSSDLSLWKVNLWISFPSYNTEEKKKRSESSTFLNLKNISFYEGSNCVVCFFLLYNTWEREENQKWN